MDLQEIIDIRYEEIEGLQQKLSEDHYMTPDQEEELEQLITQAVKFGELCAQRDAKSQAVPEGFVLVRKEIPDSVVCALKNSSYHWGDHTRDYFSPIYSLMIEVQEQSHE